MDKNSLSNSQFLLNLENFEGPIDLLLVLAKSQKVDLSEISISTLADQYVKFIKDYSDLNLEIAADYLVMASWLTYLKSRMLLPKEDKSEEYTKEEIEEAIRYQLKRLEAFQNLSKKLYSLPLLGRDFFYGGSSNGVKIQYNISYTSNFFDLIKSYAKIIQSKASNLNLTIQYSELFSVDEAMKRLKNMFGSLIEWTNFISLLPQMNKTRIINKSIVSSNFVATLDLVKNGNIEIKQNNIFQDIYIKSKK